VSARERIAWGLRRAANQKGLTTEDIADRSGLSPRQVRRILSGETAKLDVVDVVDQVAAVLGLRVDVVKAR
jgi:transcriptional regulator with XRE-family HTH domain